MPVKMECTGIEIAIKNDGSNDHPVVSVSLGNSCDFGYKLIGRQPQYIRLNSGDVVLFGGPQRMIEHCVQRVYKNTCPSYLPVNNARLNFTFRDVPELLGNESQWKYSVERDNDNYDQLVQVLTQQQK